MAVYRPKYRDPQEGQGGPSAFDASVQTACKRAGHIGGHSLSSRPGSLNRNNHLARIAPQRTTLIRVQLPRLHHIRISDLHGVDVFHRDNERTIRYRKALMLKVQKRHQTPCKRAERD